MRQAEAVGLLSCAASAALGLDPSFGARSAILAMSLSDHLGYGGPIRDNVYWYALLRFAGCNSESHAFAALVGDEIVFNQRYMQIDPTPRELLPLLARSIGLANDDRDPLARLVAVATGLAVSKQRAQMVLGGHCDVAQQLARRLEMDDAVVAALGQSRERWDGKGLFGIKGSDLHEAVRLLPVCNDVVVLLPMLGRRETLQVISRRTGTAYDPKIVEPFLAVADRLLDAMDAVEPWTGMLDAEPQPQRWLDDAQAEDAMLVIADFCDLKLPDAISHSRIVATLSVEAGRHLGLKASDLAALECAGLLHDLGYAGVPVRQRGGYAGAGLSTEAKLHPFRGEELIGRVPSLADVAVLVGRHHEALDGSGYFRGLTGAALSPAARLLAAAEAYQSFAEGRFGRPAMSPPEARNALNAEVTAGRLDAAAAKAVLAAAGHKVPIKKRELVAGLTNRELDILRLVAAGGTMKEIASQLGISPKTVDNHLQNLYPKIAVKTRAGATLFAIEHGLCSLPK